MVPPATIPPLKFQLPVSTISVNEDVVATLTGIVGSRVANVVIVGNKGTGFFHPNQAHLLPRSPPHPPEE